MRPSYAIVLIAAHIVALVADDRDVMRRRATEPEREVARLPLIHRDVGAVIFPPIDIHRADIAKRTRDEHTGM